MPVSLKNVLNEAVKVITCIKSCSLSPRPFKIVCAETGSTHIALVQAGEDGGLEVKHGCEYLICKLNQLPFFMEHHLYLKEWQSNYGYSDLGSLRHSCKNKWSETAISRKTVDGWLLPLSPTIKAEPSSKSQNFIHFVSATMSLTAPKHTFVMRLVVILMNAVFWLCSEMCQHLKNMCNPVNQHCPNDQHIYKSTHGWNSHFECKLDHGVQCNRVAPTRNIYNYPERLLKHFSFPSIYDTWSISGVAAQRWKQGQDERRSELHARTRVRPLTDSIYTCPRPLFPSSASANPCPPIRFPPSSRPPPCETLNSSSPHALPHPPQPHILTCQRA